LLKSGTLNSVSALPPQVGNLYFYYMNIFTKEQLNKTSFIFIQFLFLLIIGLFYIIPSNAQETKDFEEVTAAGKALLSTSDPKKEALKNAINNAVETAVGVQVKGDTLVQNYQLIHDRIVLKSDGYVKKWEVLKEREDGDSYLIEIKAWVGKGELNKDLFLNGIDVEMVYDWIGKPRLMILVPDYVDEKESLTTFAQAEIESLFKAKGITVLSGEQLKNIQQRDIALAFNDTKKAVALGNRFGAEIVIVGKCISQFSREIEIGGFKQVFYTSMLQAKAYRTSNAEILMSKVYTESPGETDTSAMGRFDASIKSIQNIIRSNSKDIVYQIVKNWFEGMTKAKIYQVVISNVKSDDITAIERFISTIPEVGNVFRRGFNQGVAEIEIEFGGIQSRLVDALENNRDLHLNLVGEELFRLSFEKKTDKKR